MDVKIAFAKMSAYCASAERCISEVAEKLKKMGLSPNDTQRVVEMLLKDDYINEVRYCNAYAKEKFLFNKWGKKKISYMLSTKNIDPEKVADALSAIDHNYLLALEEILRGKLRTIKEDDRYKKEAKLFRFACSRGFESDAIKEVLKSVLQP